MFPSDRNLVINWLACISAGLRPLILQYPNRRQNRSYWEDSIKNTVGLVSIHAILVDSEANGARFFPSVKVIFQSELNALSAKPPRIPELKEFTILQLSSGTTGYRKAIEFKSDDLFRHIRDFNNYLELKSSDTVVSWLPLYHDMGFIACFIMPLVLGVRIVMMDPVTWIENPQLLYTAVTRHAGTVCYMPNFGFEVMSRIAAPQMPDMRLWISCSEPVSLKTAHKFLKHTKSKPETFAPCYAMAENIFAISIRKGVQTATIDRTEVVSCGPAIHGVDVKLVDHQIWAKSPVSLQSYVGGDDIRDSDGFYPTGDLGVILDGEVYITGRVRDVIIQAGRKFFLSDVDLRTNEFLPEVRGRAACVAVVDDRIQTEVACNLIASVDFYRRADATKIEQALKLDTGIDQLSVNFVPPRFLTKTTSGKINRNKSRDDWLAVRAKSGTAQMSGSPLDDMQSTFRSADWHLPVSEALDSLSLVVLQMITFDGCVELRYEDSLAVIYAKLRSELETRHHIAHQAEDVIYIVSIAERLLFDNLRADDLNKLGEALGAPVVFEHVCTPPSPILLSDLIFSDYFQPRLDSADFVSIERALSKIRNASLLIVDDAAEMFYPPEQVYGVLSHNMERDPRADLISVRWQGYSQMHDRLPLTIVRGGDLALEGSSESIVALSEYLKVPIFSIANYRGFAPFTEDWSWRPLRGHNRAIDPESFTQELRNWIQDRPSALALRRFKGNANLNLSDAIHYCSHSIKKAPLDELLLHFNSFCIAGGSASVPYIRKRLEELNKPLIYIPSYAPEIVKQIAQPIDCILICGAMGDFQIEIPAVALQHVGLPWRTRNLEQFKDKFASYNTHGTFEDMPESGSDWFYPGTLMWGRNRNEWTKVRLTSARGEAA